MNNLNPLYLILENVAQRAGKAVATSLGVGAKKTIAQALPSKGSTVLKTVAGGINAQAKGADMLARKGVMHLRGRQLGQQIAIWRKAGMSPQEIAKRKEAFLNGNNFNTVKMNSLGKVTIKGTAKLNARDAKSYVMPTAKPAAAIDQKIKDNVQRFNNRQQIAASVKVPNVPTLTQTPGMFQNSMNAAKDYAGAAKQKFQNSMETTKKLWGSDAKGWRANVKSGMKRGFVGGAKFAKNAAMVAGGTALAVPVATGVYLANDK